MVDRTNMHWKEKYTQITIICTVLALLFKLIHNNKSEVAVSDVKNNNNNGIYISIQENIFMF